MPLAALLSGYAACYGIKLPKIQILSASLFKDAVSNEFSIKNRASHPFSNGCDAHTYTDFGYGEKADSGNGYLCARGYVLPRSTDRDSAECTGNSHTSPWDEEDVVYWDEREIQHSQKRNNIQRFFDYHIDLDKLFYVDSLRLCTDIFLVNRANNKYKASLKHESPHFISPDLEYAAYQLTTSCGITLNNILHEVIWSHCGRYLAMVHFEHPPLVPHKISIIDFKVGTVKDIPGSYALPSFIWFDKNRLDFTHLVGVKECLNFGNNIKNQETEMRLNDPQYAAEPYRLLIGNLEKQRLAAEKKVAKRARKNMGYSGASVNCISQHILLLAPNFELPVLQPPIGKKKSNQ